LISMMWLECGDMIKFDGLVKSPLDAKYSQI